MKTLLSLSGGIDSTTLLGYLLNSGKEDQITAVSFNYGSKHNKYENFAANDIAAFYGIELIELDIRQAMAGIESNLLLSGADIPEGHYEADSMKKTVVPARNMIFISILAGIAASRGIDSLAIGVHAGDHAIYPDCRPAFIESMITSVQLATDGVVRFIQAPFVTMDKGHIVQIGAECLNQAVPYALTRTCYKDQEYPCGKCGSCVERLEAFEKNGFKDPVIYEVTA